MRIAVSTGGGDAPGLNAVIRAVTLSSLDLGWEVWGIRRSFDGLLDMRPEEGLVRLDRDAVRGITFLGGTILGTTNRGDPFKWPLPDGTFVDRSEELVRKLARFDALVSIGGDGSLRIAAELHRRGVPVVGVPKTIDNDVPGTDITFGFNTSVSIATEAIDRLHSTAESHRRVMVVEVMGRHAGWIALHAGLSGTADVILIPEIPYRLDAVLRKLAEREARGRRFAIVVVAEGARPVDGSEVRDPRTGRLRGAADRLAADIEEASGKETRSLILGHLQRGGRPTTFDRMLALRFGVAAVRAIQEGRAGTMVALQGARVTTVPLDRVAGRLKTVPLDYDGLLTARALGICLGD